MPKRERKTKDMTLLTIGYGGRAPQEFIALLQEAGVQTIADIRLRPDRASMGTYTRARTAEKGIERLLSEAGIAYVPLLELGNLFVGYDDWADRYRWLLGGSGSFLTERLVSLTGSICIMCAEKRPEECHRLVLAEWLTARGWEVTHLM